VTAPFAPADLAVFDALFASVAEEMGAALARAASSTNIKERRDLSCAVFDAEGRLVAQAAHIPVHLGAMPMSVQAALEHRPPGPGDVVLLNDPWRGGTHLPDLTAVARDGPFVVANRAHHADVGGAAPGSLGLARDIFGEGVRVPPVRIVKGGELDEDLVALFLANVRAPRERREDLVAQVQTLRRGLTRLKEGAARHGEERLVAAGRALRQAAARAARETVAGLRPGAHAFEDFLDGGLAIRVSIEARDGQLVVDFAGSAPQTDLPLNANLAVTNSAVLYALALLLPPGTPLNGGVQEVVDLRAPRGSIVNADYPAAVAGGNVETSQRIVDAVLGALAGAVPGRLPAASQGTMNNLTIGVRDGRTYYETMAGGAGAGPDGPGASVVQTHMTNTRNTPIEALEHELPVRVRTFRVARGTGGRGAHSGGDGLEKAIEFLEPAVVHLLSDRRERGPYGRDGGAEGAPGEAELRPADGSPPRRLPGRFRIDVVPGDVLRVRTPGGGGWGWGELR